MRQTDRSTTRWLRMRRSGFTLLEMILTLVILGFVVGIAGLFYVVGIRGYDAVRASSDAAPKAQVAMERISLELRDCRDRVSGNIEVQQNTRITYRTTVPQLGGTRILRYDNATQEVLLNVDGTADRVLIDNVAAFFLEANATEDLDGVGSNGNEVSSISVGLTVGLNTGNSATYNLQIMPRNFVHLSP